MPIAVARNVMAQRGGTELPGSVPAPVGGWNTRDSIESLPERDAVTLENWFPGTNSVETIKGYSSYSTGLSTNVESLFEYHSGATREFFAAAGSVIYDISSSGAAASVATGYSNARWDGPQFNAYLLLFNGQDTPISYNGSTWASAGWSGSGLTASNLVDATVHKSRVHAVEKDSADFWYGGVNAVTGTLTKFSLSQIAQKGGVLVKIATLTRDGGSGPDDYACYFMSSGEVLIYAGSDPGDANNWSLVGRFFLPEPIHRRAFLQVGGDVMYLAKSDLISLKEELGRSVDEERVASKLSGAVATAAQTYGNNFGWQAVYYPQGERILFNVPQNVNAVYEQYGINTITRAAFRQTGWNARCFGIYNGQLYFGGNGVVYKGYDGLSNAGTNIACYARQAFSFLGDARDKQMRRMRPVFNAVGSFTPQVGLTFDYGDNALTQSVSVATSGTPWGSPWGSPWSPENTIRDDWFGASGRGIAVSMQIRFAIQNQQVRWHRTDYRFTPLSKSN